MHKAINILQVDQQATLYKHIDQHADTVQNRRKGFN